MSFVRFLNVHVSAGMTIGFPTQHITVPEIQFLQPNLQENMKNCQNCKRKEIENNNIRRKALNDINQVDRINFQTGNKIEKLQFFFVEVSSGSFL